MGVVQFPFQPQVELLVTLLQSLLCHLQHYRGEEAAPGREITQDWTKDRVRASGNVRL